MTLVTGSMYTILTYLKRALGALIFSRRQHIFLKATTLGDRILVFVLVNTCTIRIDVVCADVDMTYARTSTLCIFRLVLSARQI